MILAIDIGNTNIVLGCFDQEKLIASYNRYFKKGSGKDDRR